MALSIHSDSGDDSVLRHVGARLLDLAVNAGVLFSLWLGYAFVRQLTADAWDVALVNSGQMLRIQSWLGLPHEGALQQSVLGWPAAVRAANTYYMWVHFPLTGLFVFWTWLRHRHAFGVIRHTLIGVTAVGLVLHVAYPLAPPRFLPGFIDTGQAYGPDPYSISVSDAANQLAAMPSLHVGWSLIVALSVVALSARRWRWLALAHPAITMAVVVLTGNHYWTDGFVAIGLVLLAWWWATHLAGRPLLRLYDRPAPDRPAYEFAARAPRTSLPGVAPVDAPSDMISVPATKV
ncbi:MAG: phosphatase PAP2 family protein [Acidimicrobiales bacterium]